LETVAPLTDLQGIYVTGTSGDDAVTITNAVDVRVTVQADAGNDTIVGGLSPESIAGGSGDDCLVGGHADDTISGEAGKDTIYGNDGNDIINGGVGSDVMDGGDGWNVLSYKDQPQVRISFDRVASDGTTGENDAFVDDSFEECWGSAGGDTLDNRCDALGDLALGRVLHGLGGNDSIIGSNSSTSGDTLFGDDGNDYVFGGDGDDRLDGGLGADVIIGGENGSGFDKVIYGARKTAVSVILDGIANDGAVGEGDNVLMIDMVVRTPPVRTPNRAASGSGAFAIDLLDELH
jgi:Ca2+-binding RTX toxin-like protein